MDYDANSARAAPEGEDMKTVDPETARLLQGYTEDEWLTWYNALVVIAKRECKKRYWRTGNDGHLPEGHSPETIVQEAIARLFDGKRQWNHLEYPGNSPIGILRSTVESLVGDLVRSEEHKRLAYLESASDEYDDGDAEGRADRLVHRSSKNDYQLSPPPDEILYFRAAISRIREKIKDRPALLSYFDCLQRELKRSEIAADLEVSLDRVDELRKQFLARTEDIYSELFEKSNQPQRKGGA